MPKKIKNLDINLGDTVTTHFYPSKIYTRAKSKSGIVINILPDKSKYLIWFNAKRLNSLISVPKSFITKIITSSLSKNKNIRYYTNIKKNEPALIFTDLLILHIMKIGVLKIN